MRSFRCRGNLLMQITCNAVQAFSSSTHLIPVRLPSQRETHLWYVVPDEVKDASLFSEYLNLLSPRERENVSRMRGDKLQKGALLARALARTTIARYTNSQVSPSLLKFKKNTYGKPEVEWPFDENWDPPSLRFNLSHTSSLIACGVTVDTLIGIDVEEKRRKTKNTLESFARRYFSLDEVEYLLTILDPEIQRQEFLQLWTLKEAYVKALGRGFSATPFKTFTIRLGGTSGPCLLKPGNSDSEVTETGEDSMHLTTNWRFGLLELENSHYAAICLENKATQVEENDELKFKVWKTIPFVKDEFVSETDSVTVISGFT